MVRKRLRVTVVTVLQRHQEGAMLGTDHHWVHLLVGWRAGPLAADVEEDGPVRLRIIILVVVPVALLVSPLVIGVIVVECLAERARRVIGHRHSQLIPLLERVLFSVRGCNSKARSQS